MALDFTDIVGNTGGGNSSNRNAPTSTTGGLNFNDIVNGSGFATPQTPDQLRGNTPQVPIPTQTAEQTIAGGVQAPAQRVVQGQTYDASGNNLATRMVAGVGNFLLGSAPDILARDIQAGSNKQLQDQTIADAQKTIDIYKGRIQDAKNSGNTDRANRLTQTLAKYIQDTNDVLGQDIFQAPNLLQTAGAVGTVAANLLPFTGLGASALKGTQIGTKLGENVLGNIVETGAINKAPSLLSRGLAAGTEGAAFLGSQTAAETGSPSETLKSAGIGFGTGFATPFALAGAGKALTPAARALMNPLEAKTEIGRQVATYFAPVRNIINGAGVAGKALADKLENIRINRDLFRAEATSNLDKFSEVYKPLSQAQKDEFYNIVSKNNAVNPEIKSRGGLMFTTDELATMTQDPAVRDAIIKAEPVTKGISEAQSGRLFRGGELQTTSKLTNEQVRSEQNITKLEKTSPTILPIAVESQKFQTPDQLVAKIDDIVKRVQANGVESLPASEQRLYESYQSIIPERTGTQKQAFVGVTNFASDRKPQIQQLVADGKTKEALDMGRPLIEDTIGKNPGVTSFNIKPTEGGFFPSPVGSVDELNAGLEPSYDMTIGYKANAKKSILGDLAWIGDQQYFDQNAITFHEITGATTKGAQPGLELKFTRAFTDEEKRAIINLAAENGIAGHTFIDGDKGIRFFNIPEFQGATTPEEFLASANKFKENTNKLLTTLKDNPDIASRRQIHTLNTVLDKSNYAEYRGQAKSFNTNGELVRPVGGGQASGGAGAGSVRGLPPPSETAGAKEAIGLIFSEAKKGTLGERFGGVYAKRATRRIAETPSVFIPSATTAEKAAGQLPDVQDKIDWLLKNDKEIMAIPDPSLRLTEAKNKAESQITGQLGPGAGRAREAYFGDANLARENGVQTDAIQAYSQYIERESNKAAQLQTLGSENITGNPNATADQIAEAQLKKTFGEIRNELEKKFSPKESRDIATLIQDQTELFLNGPQDINRVFSGMKKLQGLKLGLSFIPNMFQSLNTILEADIPTFASGLKKAFTAFGQNFAEQAGAKQAPLTAELGKVGKFMNVYLAPFKFTEQNINRAISANTAATLAEKLAQQSNNVLNKTKSVDALSRLEELVGHKFERGQLIELTDKDLLRAANRFTKATQFGNNPLELPFWANSQLGTVFAQFKTYGYNQLKFITDKTIGELRAGNPGRAVRNFSILATMFPMSGAVVNSFRNMLTGDNTETDLLTISGYLNSIASVGAAGIAWDLIKSAGTDITGLTAAFAGPSASTLSEAAYRSIKGIQGAAGGELDVPLEQLFKFSQRQAGGVGKMVGNVAGQVF